MAIRESDFKNHLLSAKHFQPFQSKKRVEVKISKFNNLKKPKGAFINYLST